MKRTVQTDRSFNPEGFSEVLKNARGDRTLTQFAKDSGISYPYLNKYINKRELRAPLPKTLLKIADASDDFDSTYEALLYAAGYDADKYKSVVKKKEQSGNNAAEYAAIIAVLQDHILKCDFFAKTRQVNQTSYEPDYAIDISSDGPIKRWNFYILPRMEYDADICDRFYNIIGKIVISQADESEKNSIVCDSRSVFRFIHPANLNYNLSINSTTISYILIDLEQAKILEEVYIQLGSSLKTEEDMKRYGFLK